LTDSSRWLDAPRDSALHLAPIMPPITASKAVSAIVARSGNVVVPLCGTLALTPGGNGNRLEERVIGDLSKVGPRRVPRTPPGHKLPVDHILSCKETEYAVNLLLVLHEKPRRRCAGRVSADAHV
jgi:hypothetical protein